MKYWSSELLKAFAIPAIFIIVTLFFMLSFVDVKSKDTSRIVLGVMLGVVLGFTADLSKKGLDDLLKKQKLRKTSLKLLEEDAKGLYRMCWAYANLIRSQTQMQPRLPPEYNLRYWKALQKDNDFLMLGAEEPFGKIFKSMWGFEEINEQVLLAKKGDREAENFARGLYKLYVENESHKKLLLLFKTEKEIEELDKRYIEASKNRG